MKGEFDISLTNFIAKNQVFGNIAEINRVVTTRAVKLICLCDSKLYKLQSVRDFIQQEIDYADKAVTQVVNSLHRYAPP